MPTRVCRMLVTVVGCEVPNSWYHGDMANPNTGLVLVATSASRDCPPLNRERK